MKNLWKTLFSIGALLVSTGAFAQTSPEGENRIEDLDDMTFIQLLNSVDLGHKEEAQLIRDFQAKEGKRLASDKRFGNIRRDNKKVKENKITIETYRNKEVLVITIPADSLFAPNSTELLEKGERLLEVFKPHLKIPDQYRVMLAMHTDNTGSEAYRDQITQERVDAVFDYFDDAGLDTRYLFAYSFGDDMPAMERIVTEHDGKKTETLVPVENNSIFNRSRNRRLEIYLVPGEEMLKMAKQKKIVLKK